MKRWFLACMFFVCALGGIALICWQGYYISDSRATNLGIVVLSDVGKASYYFLDDFVRLSTAKTSKGEFVLKGSYDYAFSSLVPIEKGKTYYLFDIKQKEGAHSLYVLSSVPAINECFLWPGGKYLTVKIISLTLLFAGIVLLAVVLFYEDD